MRDAGGVCPESKAALARLAQCGPRALPAASALIFLCAFPAWTGAQEPQAAPQELPEVVVIGSSPVPGTGIAVDLYPGNAQTISARALAPGTASLGQVLNDSVGSVNINDTQGNAFEFDVNYRGYTASPVLGTPQGLSVYVDGVRANEPFGDIVSWDLIPQIAIANITVIPGTNPVYGLNTLGGAIAVNTKSGFAFPGASASLGLGSFGHRLLEAETGGYQGPMDYYLAASLSEERGWAVYNPSTVHQFFSKLGYQDSSIDLDLSLQFVEDTLAGNQLVAQSMLADAARGYSHPDITSTRNLVANLTGKIQTESGGSIEGNVYHRDIWRQIINSNIGDPVVAGSANQLAVCTAQFGQSCASNTLSAYTQEIYGLTLQVSRLLGQPGWQQHVSAGFNAETGATRFAQAAQQAIVDSGFATIGVDAFAPQAGIESHNRTAGLYLTDTMVFTERASATISVRGDHSRIDLEGNSVDSAGTAVAVTGSHSYQRLNPAIGGTYAAAAQTTLFANLAQGFRTPSAIELACADPLHPCAGVPNAFSSDPDLRAIRATSLELGGRGRIGLAHEGAGTGAADLSWRTAAFLSNLSNDILFNQSTLTTGYFSNAGATRRDGLELSVEGKARPVDFAASASVLDARYRSAFVVANGANPGSACPGSACVPVHPGDRIPGIPRQIAKLRLGWQANAAMHVETLVQAQGPSFARGNENNLPALGRIPGFALTRIGFTRRVGARLDLVGSVSNVFNRQYANFGMLSRNDLKGGAPENFLAVGQPRTLFLGVKATM